MMRVDSADQIGWLAAAMAKSTNLRHAVAIADDHYAAPSVLLVDGWNFGAEPLGANSGGRQTGGPARLMRGTANGRFRTAH